MQSIQNLQSNQCMFSLFAGSFYFSNKKTDKSISAIIQTKQSNAFHNEQNSTE